MGVHGDFIGSHRRVSIIPDMILLLAALASVALAQQPPQQSPTWFIPSQEKGAQDESAFCAAELAKTSPSELYKTRTSGILLPRSASSSPSLPTSSATAPAAEESVTTSAASSDLPARTSPTLPPTQSGTRPRLDVTTTERLSASHHP